MRDLATGLAVVALVMSAGAVFAQVPAVEQAPAAPAVAAPVELAPVEAAPVEMAPVESEMQDVESSLIKEVGYDAATKLLTVVLVQNDEKYLYKNVPEDIYAALMAAESKGKYFVENIKGKFEFTKE
jgi:hypothetical protein